MSYFGSPRIVTNGLIFYYDADNSSKSWKGKPTTNYVTNASTMASFNNYSYGTPVKFETEFGTTGYRMSSLPSWNGVYQGISLPSTGTYTFSAWYRYWGGSSNNNGAQCYVSGWGGGDSASGLDKSKIGVWQRVSITLNCTNTSMTLYLISYGGSSDGNSDHSTWEVTMPQVESGSYATPFVSGTRSTTDAIIDLGPYKNTVTINGLTYNSDNTFSFDGSTNYATISTFNSKPTTAMTVESWIKPQKASVGTGTIRGGSISCTNSMYLGIIDSTDGGSTFSLHFANQTSVNRLYNWNGNIPNNAWSHIAGTYDGATMRAYLNGVEIYSASQTGTITDGTYVLGTYGGSLTDGVHNFKGLLPNSKIYNRALSAAEIAQNFNAHKARYGL